VGVAVVGGHVPADVVHDVADDVEADVVHAVGLAGTLTVGMAVAVDTLIEHSVAVAVVGFGGVEGVGLVVDDIARGIVALPVVGRLAPAQCS